MSLSVKAVLKNKGCKLIALFSLFPLFSFSQTLTGLWTGSLSNDSTTVRRDQSFEIALTEYKGKVYGYSRSEFIVNDTLFYIVKRVKGTIDGDICEVTDDEIIAYNFRGKLDKGIKVTSTFKRSQTDSTWHLEGSWKTNATKKYYSVTGKVGLEEEKDLTASKIFPHLEELNLANDIAFYKERTETAPVVKVIKPEKNVFSFNEPQGLNATTTTGIAATKPELYRAESDYIRPLSAPEKNQQAVKENGKVSATNATGIAVAQPSLYRAETDYVKPLTSPAKIGANNSAGISANDLPVNMPSINQPQLQTVKADMASVDEKKDAVAKPAIVNVPVDDKAITSARQQSTAVSTQEKQKDETVKKQLTNPATNSVKPVLATADKKIIQPSSPPVGTQTTMTAKQPVAQPLVTVKKTETVTAPDKTNAGISSGVAATPEVKKPLVDVTQNAAVISGRKSAFTQEVNFKSDSLVIALYDNGEIDGDTVSVYLNGQVIMARQGLKASAVKKTIYITPGNEDFSLVLFADNLGKYPPNTGLLVVYDGDDTYNLRFSSDFQKNAGIVFRRKQ